MRFIPPFIPPLPASAVCLSVMCTACGSKAPPGFIPTSDAAGGDDSPPFTADSGSVADAESFGEAVEAGTGLPRDCAEAAASKSYIGCDYWPTPVTNGVWSIFDFTVIVANTMSTPAVVTVTSPDATTQTVTVQPGQLANIFLPWIPALKGADFNACGKLTSSFGETIMAPKSAYHLVSSQPVTVYQFNALEYKGQGGPPGKDWSACPGNLPCSAFNPPMPVGCYSYSNDASVLLPSTAMTGNYRVTGEHAGAYLSGYFAVTATQDGTNVSVKVSPTGNIGAGGGIPAMGPGATATFTLNAGDVAEIVSDFSANTVDLSGSLVHADKPVQVIAGIPCTTNPLPFQACDHLESAVLPAETLGKHYVVTVPTSPGGTIIGHTVRFYGNVDGTNLTYLPALPPGCPTTLNAGQVAECAQITTSSFEVKGDHEFAVSSFMLGGELADPTVPQLQRKGDPSMSPMVATEQYRMRYIFLAPPDYDESYIDIAAPPGASLTLDGAPVTQSSTPISASYGVVRVPVSAGAHNGAHELLAGQPVGVQVIGYGMYTSYQYPAGLDLAEIAPPPK